MSHSVVTVTSWQRYLIVVADPTPTSVPEACRSGTSQTLHDASLATVALVEGDAGAELRRGVALGRERVAEAGEPPEVLR